MNAPYRDSYSGGGGLALPRPTPVVKKLLLVNFGVFLLTYVLFLTTVDASRPGPPWFYKVFGLYPPWWGTAPPFLPVWQLVTHGFLHSVGTLSHVFWNMVQLYFFGTLLEELIGSRRFLAFYFGAMLAGGVSQLVADEVMRNPLPAVGASGACLGVLVAAAVLRPNTTVILLFIPIALKWLVIGIVAIDLFALTSSLKMGGPSFVAHWAHLGGAAFGFVVARRGWIWIDPVEAFERRQRTSLADRERSDQQRMDALLAKIHREGMGALTKRERDFLKRMSARR